MSGQLFLIICPQALSLAIIGNPWGGKQLLQQLSNQLLGKDVGSCLAKKFFKGGTARAQKQLFEFLALITDGKSLPDLAGQHQRFCQHSLDVFILYVACNALWLPVIVLGDMDTGINSLAWEVYYPGTKKDPRAFAILPNETGIYLVRSHGGSYYLIAEIQTTPTR